MQWARAVKPLRVGLLLETRASDAYTATLCDWLAEHGDLELALVLVTDGAPPGRAGRKRRPAPQGPTAPLTAPQPSPRTPLLFAGVMAL